jgi:hypothetical protein
VGRGEYLIGSLLSLLPLIAVTARACPGAEFLDEIQTKVLRVFLLTTALPRDLYFFKLTQRRKEENLIETTPLFLWFKKFIQKPQV